VTGGFGVTVDFDPGDAVDNHTSKGFADAFLSEFSPGGDFLWVRTWGGAHEDVAELLALDPSGNVYVTGCFNDIVDFDPGSGVDNHTSHWICDGFLSKFDSSGDFLWARTWGSGESFRTQSVAADASGNACVAGWFDGTADFDPGSGVDNHTSNGLADAFLTELDPSGDFLWACTWGGAGHYDEALSVAIDASGNAYVAGHFSGTVDFDPGGGVDDHSSNASYDAFLSKFDSIGNFLWAATWGGVDSDNAYSVAVDAPGNAYVAGCFCDTVDFDPGSGADNHTSNAYQDVFLTKFLPDGNW
jgi:hypothetical protein